MNTNRFTQEIKDKWLTALKSGNYKQGFGQLHNIDENTFCCIGVLQEECLKSNKLNGYMFLDNTIGVELENQLWKANDAQRHDQSYPRDYSNVIPLVEQLPVYE